MARDRIAWGVVERVGGLSRRAALRRLGGVAVAAVGVARGVGSAHAAAQDTDDAAEGQERQVYFGWLLGTSAVAAVALDVGELDDAGARDVRAYVCDGLGLPAGMAVWFRGPVDEETVKLKGGGVTLTSPSDQETLLIGYRDAHAVTGAYTGADGRTSRFAAFRAIDGAGIYDVTLDEELRYHGTSTDGAELTARAFEDGRVVGTIIAADGQEIPFEVQTLARLPEATLSEVGLPTDYVQYAANSIVPDTYVALISPGALFWLGRSGSVRTGSPGNNIIGLDMCD